MSDQSLGSVRGCTDDNPCRLGDAGSMTFLPWFVPRTEPPVQLREVGPDRCHLLIDSCSDVHLHVCRCRIGDEDCCCSSAGSRRQISLLVLASSLIDRGCCSSEYCNSTESCSTAAAAASVAAARGGGGPQEAIRPSRWWSRSVGVLGTGYLCVSWAESSCPTESRREKNNEKPTANVKTSRQPIYAHA